MTTDFWTRVLAEYDASDPDEWALCCASKAFRDAFHADTVAFHRLADWFLTNTDVGQRFLRGHVYLFVFRRYSDSTDDERVAALRAVRRDFLLWARDNDRDLTTNKV